MPNLIILVPRPMTIAKDYAGHSEFLFMESGSHSTSKDKYQGAWHLPISIGVILGRDE